MSDSVLASEIYAIRLETLIGVSTNALAIFEFVMTLDREVSSVWKGKRSGASWLLFAVRYTMLASAIEDLVGLTKLNYRGCVVSLITSNILVIFSFLLTAMFSSLRVYALCGGSLKLSAVAFLLQLSPVVVNAYSYVGNTYGVDPIFGCLVDDHFSLKTVDALTLAARIPLIFGDAFVIIITCIKTFQLLKAQHKIGMRLSLSVLLFRDGAVYFIILLILNILELCPLTSYDGGVAIGDLNRALPLILVNQFMLNLRQLDDDGIRTTSQVHTVTTPMFQMSIDIAGNMGESLEYGWESEARGDEELDVQGDPQDNEMLELQETLRDDEPETHDVPRGDEEAGPSKCRSE